jgi:hypothetical protein
MMPTSFQWIISSARGTVLPEGRMRKGINPKLWFYRLRDALVAEQNRPCVLAGAACEQWINGELFRVVARGLDGTSLTAYPEWNGRQHDVVVMRHAPSDGAAWSSPVAIIECKVVYPSYSASKRARYLDRLIEQLAVPHLENPARAGFFIGLYAYWPDYREPKESFSDFRSDLGCLLRDRAKQGDPSFEIRMDHGGAMETFLEETPAKIGAASVVVGCVAQYIRLLPSSA